MKHSFKRVISLLLSVMMIISMLPAAALADEVRIDSMDVIEDVAAIVAEEATEEVAPNEETTLTNEVVEIRTWEDLKALDARVEGGDMMEGVAVKLMNDIDLYEMGTDGEPVTFNPIGANQAYFKGTFDGQGHTIKNMYQSGWALGYDWDHYGTIGLFAYLWNATIKNLTIENAECFVEGGNVAGIAGCAWGDCTFENITIKNSTYATYNNRAAGIVGYTGGGGTMTFNGVTVDEDTVIGGLWGSFDSSLGGVVGSIQDPTKHTFEDVTVECRLDAYNDVTAAYIYYAYRMCGMLIGKMPVDDNNQPILTNVTIGDNVVIDYSNTPDYTYAYTGSGSKSGWNRVEAGYAYGGVDLTQHPDAAVIYKPSNAIFGGQQYGSYGQDDHKDITVLGREAAFDGDYFTSLETAVKAADGATDSEGNLIPVELMADCSGDIVVTKSLVLDENGCSFTGNVTTVDGYEIKFEDGVYTAVKEVVVLSGSGTAEDPYLIQNLKELKAFRDYVNGGNTYAGQYVKLTADIDLTNVAWTPIGTSNYDKTPTTDGVKMFAGNFDGGNHTITGLSSANYVPDSTETGSTEYSFGLFGYVYGANISNVKLANVNIDCGTRKNSAGADVYGSGIAALVGYYVPANEKTVVIENCHVLSGTVSASNNMGGLIGHMDSQTSQPKVDITIKNCSNAAAVTTEAREAGGILGLMNSAREGEGNYIATMRGTVTFENCTNTGAITSLGDGAPSAGGILGRDHNQQAGQHLKVIFDGCKNSGTITVTANGETHAAGIGAGYYAAGAWLIADGCTNTGDIVVVNPGNDVYAGGLISYGGVVELINSTSTGSVTGGNGNTYVGGAQSILFLDGMENYDDTVVGNTYYLNGGTSPERAALVDDAAGGGNFHLVETAYKNGYQFKGWYDNAALTGDACTALVKGVKTYYAKWHTDYVAMIGEAGYETLADAIAAATAGQTITFLTDITEDVTINKAVTIDGAGKTYTGAMILKADTTIKNVNFDGKGYNGYAVTTRGAQYLTIENCTAKNYGYGFVQLASATALTTVKNVTVSNMNYGVKVDYSNAVVLENVDITAAVAAVLNSNYGEKTITIKNSKLNILGTWKRNDTIKTTYVFEGANTVGKFITEDAIDVFKLADANSTLTAPEGKTVTTDVEDGKVVYKNGAYSVIFGLVGSGTEEDPYLITDVKDFKWFRDDVNGGNNYAGKYVKLTDNIDLANENWTPIGDTTYNSKYAPADSSVVFSGVFDGNGKVISNLKIERYLNGGADADANLGLFGITGENAVIKNLTITNVDIDTDGRNVGALAGFAYKTTLDKITVNGDIQIKGGNNVSGVVAMTRHYAMSATNITVSGNAGSTITGNNIVGGIFAEIAPNGTEQTFENLRVENVAITGVGGVGGIVGLLTTGAVDTVSVKNVALTGRTDYQGNAMGRIRLGSVAGLMGGQYATIANAAVENVTAKNLVGNAVVLPVIGANYDAASNETEAKIGDKYYATFAAAYKAAANGETITLLTPVVVKAGKTLTLDKAVTVTYTSNVPGEDMITNNGTLVVEGTTLVYTNTDTTASNVTVSTISAGPGSVTKIQSGVVKNDSANNGEKGIYAFALDLLTNGSMGDVTATISGGEVISTNYMAIRQFNNGTACKNTLEITGGEIYGKTRAIQVHLKNNAAYTTISGGTIEGGSYALCFFPTDGENISVTGGTFTGSVYSGTNGIITGGTYSEEVYADYCAEGYVSVKNANGTYSVEKDPSYGKVAQIGNEYFATLADAIAAATAGQTITFLTDITEDVTISKAVTIDGAGKTYTGKMTLKADTTIKNVNFDGKGYNGYAVTTRGANYLTIEDCTAKNYGYGFVQLASGTALTTVKNVTVSNMNYGVKVDYSNAVVLENVDITAAVAAVLNSNYGEKTITIKNSKLNILGTWKRNDTIKTTYVFEGANTVGKFITEDAIDVFKLADANSTLTAPEGKTVTTDVEDGKVVYKNGTYSVVVGLTGSGTEEDPYLITNVDDLNWFRDDVNGGNKYSGKYVKLMADIDLGGAAWTPINSFAGTFDGNGDLENGTYTISNFTIDATASHGGFFNVLEWANVHDLTLSNVEATVGAYRYGTLARSINQTKVDNITVKNVVVTTTASTAFVAGLVCHGTVNSNMALNNCTVENLTVNAEKGAYLIAGIVTFVQKNGTEAEGTNILANLNVNGFKVTVNDTDDMCAVGGLVGQTQSVWQNPRFNNCSVSGLDVTATGSVDVGGFMCYPGSWTYAENCTTEGKIDVTGVTSASNFAGGFFGNYGWGDNVGKGDHKVTNCSTNVNIITKIASAGGFVGSGTNSEGKNKNITLTACEAKGTVTVAEGGTAYIGGFAGTVDRGIYNSCTAAHEPFIGYVAEGKTLTQTNSYVAKVGTVYYANFDNALAAAKEGDTVTILATVTVTEDKSYDFTGLTITAGVNPAIRITNDANVTVKGGEMKVTDGYCFILGASDGTSAGYLTIESGKFHGATTVASVTKGTLTINGGEFSVEPYEGSYGFLLNCVDANYANGSAKIVVTGGTFANFNPANNAAEGTGTNFVADGYVAVENANGTYDVAPNMIFEMHLTDANGEAHWLSPMSSNDLNSIIEKSKIWYESLQGTYSFTLKILEDCTVKETVIANFPMTIDLNGKTITADGINPAIRITNGANVIVKNGTMVSEEGYCFILGASDGTSAGNLTIESGKFHGATTVASVTKGTLTINGGEFSVDPYEGSYGFLLNCVDANYANGSAKIVVTGGTFANFNPANNAAEGTGTNFVAAGYESYKLDDTTYGIREASEKVAEIVGGAQYTTLQAAIDDAATGATIKVLTDLNLDTTNLLTNSGGYSTLFNVAEKNVTIDLNTKTITVTANANDLAESKDAMLMGVFTVDTNGGLTLKNGTVEVKANDATVYALATCYGEGGTLTFESGTYTADKVDSALIYSQYDEVVTVKDGTYTLGNVGTGSNGSPWIFNAKGQNTANVIVIGGTYNADVFHQHYIFEVKDTTEVAELLNIPAKAAKNNGDGTWTIVDAVALVNEQHKSGNWYTQYTGYATFEEALAAVGTPANGVEEYVTLLKTVELTTDLDLGGKTVKVADTMKSTPAFRVLGNVTVSNGTVDATDGDSTYAFIVGNNDTAGNLTITDGTYKGRVTAVSVTKGTATITGGTFEATEYNGAHEFTLNCIDANYNNGSAKIEVKGGTFKYFDPMNNAAEGKDTNYVAAGYESYKLDDTTYGIREASEKVAEIVGGAQYTTLQAAIDDAKPGDEIIVLDDIDLADTELQLLDDSYDTYFLVEGKSVTINLAGKKISGAYTGAGMLVGVFSVNNGGSLTLTGNGTVDVTATGKVYSLIANYAEGCFVTIKNGTYKLDKASDSLIYTDGDENVTIYGGTFTLGNVGSGSNGSPWIFNASGQNTKNVIVIGGTYNADVFHQHYIFEVKDTTEVAELLNIPAKAAKNNGDGTWTIVDAVAYVNEQHWSGAWYAQNTGYATLQEAVNAVKDVQTKNGKTSGEEYVTLLTNITLTDAVEINKSLKLDLNTNTLTGELTLTTAEATLTSEQGLNVTTNVANSKVVYEDGVYKVVEGAELFDITSSSLVLGNEIAMYFYVKNTDLNGDDYVAVVTKTYADGTEKLTVDIPYSEWEAREDGRMRFKFDGIAAKEMADNINVVIYTASTKEAVSNPYNDSVRGYVERGFEDGKATGELATMLVDMVNYGAAAQRMFSYDAENLANMKMDAYQGLATPSVTCTNNQVKGLGYVSASLVLESNIVFNMKFSKSYVTTDMTAVATYTDHYGENVEIRIPGSEFEDRGSTWGILVEELVPADARQIITCKFIDADGNEVEGVYGQDSIESVCARAIAGGGGDYYEFIMKFATAAYNYFH